MQFPAFWADFKSSLYVKSEVKDGEFTDSSVNSTSVLQFAKRLAGEKSR